MAGPLAGKLTDVQDNQASSWLPASAESTQALDEAGPLPEPERHPDRRGLPEDRRADPGRPRHHRQPARPDPASIDGAVPAKAPDGSPIRPARPCRSPRTGRSPRGLVTFNFGKDGWNKLPDVKDQITAIAALDGADVYVAGPGGQAADSAAVFAGIDGKLLYATIIVVVVILLLHLPQPAPVAAAGDLGRRRADDGAGGDLPAREERRPHRQRPERRASSPCWSSAPAPTTPCCWSPDTAKSCAATRTGTRRWPSRSTARRRRSSPARCTVILGMLCLTFAEMNSTAGLGPVAAIGIGVGLLVMITLLPALLVIFGRWIFWPRRPTFDTARAERHGLLGPRRLAHRTAPAHGLGGHVARPGGVQPGLPPAQRPRARRPPTPTPRTSTRSPASRC